MEEDIMIFSKDIKSISDNFSIGTKINVEMPCGEEKHSIVEAEIIGKYPRIALLQHKNIKWCVKWEELDIYH